jgi:hypothetical protein
MIVPDYLQVDFSEVDDERLLENWRWLITGTCRPVMVTFLGDIFLKNGQDGSIHFLNTLKGTFTHVADSEEEWRDVLRDRDQRMNWLPSPFYLQLKNAHGPLETGYCYSCEVPPSLGGEMESDNFAPADLEAHHLVLGQLQNQIKDIPHGTQVDIIIEREGDSPAAVAKSSGKSGGFFSKLFGGKKKQPRTRG